MTFKMFVELLRLMTGRPSLRIYPGPDLPDEEAGECLVLTRSGGPGFLYEQLLDAQGWQVRSIGDQNNYDGAEYLAFQVDSALACVQGYVWYDNEGAPIGRLTLMTRTGSPPTPDRVDDAQRHHFVASYTSTVVSNSPTPTGGS